MFWIIVQIADYLTTGRLTLLLAVFIIGMCEYLLFLSWFRKYKPYKNNFRVPTSIVMPVFREKPELLIKALESVKKQMKLGDELITVFDGKDEILQNIAKDYSTKILIKDHSGKRDTLSYGCDNAKNEIILTLDSDTVLCPECLDEVIKPFIDSKIGAVSGYQRIINADMNLASKFADYNELMSHGFLQKATSAAGNVPVLYGRCLAIRKDVWKNIGYKYKNKLFRGNKVESGDDNDITVLTIKLGYRTWMQSTAKITSDCPRDFWKRLRQQYRFNRSSMRITMTDWVTNFEIIKKAKLGFVNQMTSIIFPFLILGVWIEWISHTAYGYQTIIELHGILLLVTGVVTLLSVLGMRNILLLEKKKDIGIWMLYLIYSWSVLNVLNMISILTIWRENPGLVQYSRNE